MMSIIYEMIRLSFEDTLLGSAELSNPVSSNFFHKKWWNREGKMQDLKTYLQLSAWGSVTQCKIFPIPYGTTQKIKRFWQLFFQLQEMPRGWVFLNRNQELTASWPVIRTGRCPNDLGQSLLDRPDISAASPARPNTQSKSSSISASRPLPEQSHFHYHQPT